MCFPVPSCSCAWSRTEETSIQELSPLQGETPPPVTIQPRTKTHTITVSASLDPEEGLKTLLDAGNLFTQILNSKHTQRGAKYCQNHCSPWCESSCPNWLSHCFQCLCSCVINEEEPQSHPNTDFFQQLRSKYGPIIAGLGIQASGIDINSLMLTGRSLNEEEKTTLRHHCKAAKISVKDFFYHQLQKEVFSIAAHLSSLPSIGGEETKSVREGFHCPVLQNPPTVWIAPNHCTTAPELMKPVNWPKLEKQLQGILFRNVETGRNQRMVEQESCSVINTMRNAFYYLVLGSPCFQSQIGHDEYNITVTQKVFLQFLLCSLLALKFVPVDEEGNPPQDTWSDLLKIINYLQINPSLRRHSPYETPYGYLDDWDGVEVDGKRCDKSYQKPETTDGLPQGTADSSGRKTEASWREGSDGDGFFGPKEQECLLSLSTKTKTCASKVFLM